MSSTRTLESVEPNGKLLYIPYQNLDIDSIMRDAPGRIILSMPSSATTRIKSQIENFPNGQEKAGQYRRLHPFRSDSGR